MQILLFSDIPPCKDYAGGLFLDQLCRLLPEGSLACFAVVNPHLNVNISPDLSWIPIEYYEKPHEMARRILPRQLGSLSAFTVESYRSLIKTQQVIDKAIKFGREFGADILWCLLEGQTMIRAALPVAKGLGLPLLTQVMDPPYWWLREHRLDRVSAGRVLKEFDRAVRASASCAAASWAMAEEYKQLYGTKTVALLPSLDSRLALPPAAGPHPGNDFVIGMAGQTYAMEEWRALIAALDTIDWKLSGRDVRIRLLGRDAQLKTNTRMRIEFLGWNPQQETIRLLSETDVLYCPYWFDRGYETEARLSFPSKLTTYFAAGRPVLFHGPEYASPARFLREQCAGVLCHSLQPTEIIDALRGMATDTDSYSRLTDNGRLALEKYLTLEPMRRNLAEFLQVEERLLAPISGK
jgi:hypothetical protein